MKNISINSHIATITVGFFLLLTAAFIAQAGIISLGFMALIAALWFVSFIGQVMYIAAFLGGE